MSRFVSAGTGEEPPERDDEWLQAQKELDENRRRKEEASREQDGKSLYEVLQANKGSHARSSAPVLFTIAHMTGSPT